MTADRRPVKQAAYGESRYEQSKNQEGHRHEPAEAHPGPEQGNHERADNDGMLLPIWRRRSADSSP